MAPTYKLSYFQARGFAEQSRFCFAYAGVPFEDIRYEFGDSWEQNRNKFEWGSLPVLEVDGKQIAQSTAILRYLGKVFNLAGDNDFESGKCDEMIEALQDLRKSCVFMYAEKDEKVKAEKMKALIVETLPKYFQKWNDILEKNAGFLVGNRFSYADFGIAVGVDMFSDQIGVLDNYPALKAHHQKVFSAPGIKEWVAKRPITED